MLNWSHNQCAVMAMPFSRYDFVRHSDGTWTWQCTSANKSTTSLSVRRKDIGSTMADAIVHGFRPSADHWIIDDLHSVSYFEPDGPAKTLTKADTWPDDESRAGAVAVGLS